MSEIYPLSDLSLFTASTSVSMAVSDISRISCIRRISYRCTICRQNTDTARIYRNNQI